MDLEFISRAEKVTSFNLSASDFTTTKYKEEIQHLFNKHFFPDFDVKSTINGSNVSAEQINRVILKLKTLSSGHFNALYNYNIKGVGPGEVMLYFILNDARLGGGSSAGADIIIGNTSYEVKAAKISTDNHAYGFMLGGTLPIPEYITQLDALRQALKLPGSKTEISTTILKSMKDKAPERFKMIEDSFAQMAYDGYFKPHKTIFINNNKSSKMGNIESIKQVRASDITLNEVTAGTIKPRVKL